MMYTDWIKRRLPKKIPDDVIKAGMNFGGYVTGLQFWEFGERGPDRLAYTAADEEDLKLFLFERAARSIAQKMELINRSKEEKNWRYIQDHVEHGAWIYRENKRYKYNAIHDTRKYWMEYELRLLHPILPTNRWMQKVEYYEHYMNLKFQIKHWKYNVKSKRFIEISHSKELDTHGVEQPAQGTIMEIQPPSQDSIN